MTSPGDYNKPATLRNGLRIRIRAIRPDDKARLAHAFQQLQPEILYTRFSQAKTELSAEELKAVTEVDFHNVVALVAVIHSGEEETIIGGVRYFVMDRPATPRKAEIAFLVEEDYQGQGLAGLLLRHVAQIARAEGVEEFVAEVLAQNRAMLAVFARSGLVMKRVRMDDAIQVTVTLAGRRATGGDPKRKQETRHAKAAMRRSKVR